MNAYKSIKPVTGASLIEGSAYHDIPGLEGDTQRNGSLLRAEQIARHLDVRGKTGVDIGCSVGGISFGLIQVGAKRMVGYDYDEDAILMAGEYAIREYYDAEFFQLDLTTDGAFDQILANEPDFVIWLSNWMWIARWNEERAKELLMKVSLKSPVLVFETAEAEGSLAGNFGIQSAEDVMSLLDENTAYSDIECIGPNADGWHSRHVFIARK